MGGPPLFIGHGLTTLPKDITTAVEIPRLSIDERGEGEGGKQLPPAHLLEQGRLDSQHVCQG